MSARIRPSLWRNVPVLAFSLGGGLFGLLVADVPAIVRFIGVMFVAAFVPLLVLLLTTWFEFDDGVARVAVFGRVREFRRGESTMRLHPLAVGLFKESTAVELQSGDARRTVTLAVFGPDDSALIKRELRSLFGTAAQK